MPFIFNFSLLYTLYRFFYLNLKIPITEVTHYSLGDSFDISTRKRRILLQSDYLIRGSWKKIVDQNDFCKQKIIKCFANGPITFVNLRAVSREVSKFKRHESFQWLHIVESWILLVRLQKYLRIFSFQKSLRLDNLLSSAPVRVVAQ